MSDCIVVECSVMLSPICVEFTHGDKLEIPTSITAHAKRSVCGGVHTVMLGHTV